MLNKITGPVVPLPTPFKENQDVDYDALSSYVSFLCDKGIKTVMTTVGTSRFHLLSMDEVKSVNEVVVKAAEKDTVTIVANPSHGSLKDSLSLARHAEKIGADIFLAHFPDRYYGENEVYNFFEAIAKNVDIDILIHETPIKNGLGGGYQHYSIELLTRLFKIRNIIGLKEEALDLNHSENILKTFSDKAVIIGAGGGMSRYVRDYWLGARTYLSGIANFYPELELEFYNAMEDENYKKAYNIVHNTEKPFFEITVPMGWHRCLKESLSICGLLPPYERSPMSRISNKNIEILKDVMQKNGWIK